MLCIHPNSSTVHFLQLHQDKFLALFVRCCTKESMSNTSVKGKKKKGKSILQFYLVLELKTEVKGMLKCCEVNGEVGDNHSLLLPRIVFMLPFEDLHHLGIVFLSSSKVWIRAVCHWNLVSRTFPPTLLIAVSGEDEWIKKLKALEMSEIYYFLWYFNEVAAYGNQEIPHSGNERGLC